ncbi:glutamyl aminopeptidase-like [Centruroides sculpturatus]|uniref:glutamyl aminopeptidase-like n=1 Tax=Centruroides sculpturatus TaxID=218467 RepID=UPI000C6E1ECD|nr:glutamyl aminopeptidase-like [Centruroides sculpturatus]
MFVRRSTAFLSVIIVILTIACVGLIVHTVRTNSGDCVNNNNYRENPGPRYSSSIDIDSKSEITITTTEFLSTITDTPPPSKQHPWDYYRLPSNVIPLEYDLLLDPKIEEGIFSGRVNIKVDVKKSRDNFIVHCYKTLNITGSWIKKRGNDIKINNSFKYEKNEFYVIEIERVEPGLYELMFEFKGSLVGSIIGFYRSQYKDPFTGKIQYLATSKFQPTYARRAFPCFDEPNFKSNFTISLVHSENLIPLSNMPIDKQTKNGTKIVTTFKESVPMVTYLVCFIVSNFQYTSVNFTKNREIRVYSTPHQIEKTQYALQISKTILTKFEEYFGIEYPLPKQDLIAIPDFVSGAMEHWGIITFREVNLLFDKITTTPKQKERVAIVISHELAHMWFGNLVTMKWWDDLWLNEGFASFIEYKGVDWVEPNWNMLDQFLIDDVQPVMEVDVSNSSHPIIQPVGHPDEINEIFDIISYSKGAAVLRMLEFFLEPENFRRGISVRFFYEFKTDKSIAQIMDTWTRQKGFPMVTIKTDTDSNSLIASQKVFSRNPGEKSQESDTVWSIPLSYTSSSNETGLVWLHDKSEKRIRLNSSFSWIKFNNQQYGYFIVNYERSLWDKLLKALRNDFEAFSPSDRSNLLFDSFQLAWSGYLDYEVAFGISEYLVNETQLTPWKTATKALKNVLNLLKPTDSYYPFKKFLQRFVIPIYNQVGWNQGDNHLENRIREVVLKFACEIDYPDCLENAYQRLKNWFERREEIPKNVKELVYFYGMSQIGNDEYWNEMWQRYQNESSSQERTLLLLGLSQVRYPHLLQRFLNYAMNESKVKRQDFFHVLKYISWNDIGRPLVWDFIRSKWPYLVERYTLHSRYLGRSITICKPFQDEFHLREMKDFFQKYPDAGAGKSSRQQTLENVENNIKWVKLHSDEIRNWLKSIKI